MSKTVTSSRPPEFKRLTKRRLNRLAKYDWWDIALEREIIIADKKRLGTATRPDRRVA
jgi:hypothetical protein